MTTTRRLPAPAGPLYCEHDGQPLREERSTRSQGFDPYTGERRPDLDRVKRVCPANQAHTSWMATDAGEWMRA